jgi:hypothetical protein
MIGTKTTLRGTEIKNNDGVVLTPSIGQMLSALLVCKNSCDLVELTGIEPVTSCLQSRRSPN